MKEIFLKSNPMNKIEKIKMIDLLLLTYENKEELDILIQILLFLLMNLTNQHTLLFPNVIKQRIPLTNPIIKNRIVNDWLLILTFDNLK